MIPKQEVPTPSSWSQARIFEGEREAAVRKAQTVAENILCSQGGADRDHFRDGNLADYTRIEEEKIPLDQVRELTAGMYRRPLESRFRVFQIDYADHLREEAQNALLKSLEEPPDYLVWLLVVDYRVKLLRTIRSRCQIVHVGGQSKEESLSHDEETLLFRLLDQAFSGEGAILFDRKDLLHDFLSDKHRLPDAIVSILRDMLQYKTTDDDLEAHPQRKEEIGRLAAKVSYRRIARAMEQVEELRGWLDVNINAQMAWEHVFLHLGRPKEDGHTLV